MTDPILATWTHLASSSSVLVTPDGCRDVIVRWHPGCQPTMVCSALADASHVVETPTGTRFLGFRMAPGIRLGLDTVGATADLLEQPDLIADRLRAVIAVPPALVEALGRLAEMEPGEGLAGVCADLGVSQRTLQRHVLAQTGRSPGFWRRLARVRGAARAICGGAPAADTSAAWGYADQAHLTREMRHWFGLTPSRLRQRPDIAAQLAQPGYG